MPRAIFALTFAILIAVTTMFLALVSLHPALAQSPSAIQTSTLIWPISGTTTPDTPSISSPFGPRWQASHSRYDYHPGIDIAAPQNTPVHVITDGVVSELGWLSNSAGLAVVVYHPSLDLYSAYLHLNSTAVAISDTVTQGQVIGAVGDTGITSFMHLHFEIRLTATNYPTSTRNPLGFLPHPDVTTPTVRIESITADPIYSPTVSLVITNARTELDMNTITVTVRDKTSGEIVETRAVIFNQRIPTGADTLATTDTTIIPSHFNTATAEYELRANFDLNALDSFTLTAEATDLTGHTARVSQVANDMTPPAKIDTLSAVWQANGGVTLHWVAPGDSGMVGTAAQYDIRYSGSPIDSFTWFSATPISLPPLPLTAGDSQTFSVTDSLPSPVYFAIKTSDSEGNLALLSNSAQATHEIYLPIILR